jgi:hypothetical protein
MTVPLSLMTIDGLPNIGPATIDDTPLDQPIEPCRQTAKRSHASQYAPPAATCQPPSSAPDHGPSGLSGTPPDHATRTALSQDGDAA